MKIAFLIMAHAYPAALARLLRTLVAIDDAEIYVHVDRKSSGRLFAATRADFPRVRWLERRTRVQWGGFSQVEATLALMRTARAEQAYGRYVLLSGQDILIKPVAEVRAVLGGPCEFIRVDREVSLDQRSPLTDRVRYRWFHDRSKLLLPISGRLRNRRPLPAPLFQGSSWWALSGPAVNWLIARVDSEPGWAEYFRDVSCADEIFFHTLIKQSPFADSISHDFERCGAEKTPLPGYEHGCHYIDWLTPNVTLPKALDVDDLPALIASPALFARKVDERSGQRLELALNGPRPCGKPD